MRAWTSGVEGRVEARRGGSSEGEALIATNAASAQSIIAASRLQRDELHHEAISHHRQFIFFIILHRTIASRLKSQRKYQYQVFTEETV